MMEISSEEEFSQCEGRCTKVNVNDIKVKSESEFFFMFVSFFRSFSLLQNKFCVT